MFSKVLQTCKVRSPLLKIQSYQVLSLLNLKQFRCMLHLLLKFCLIGSLSSLLPTILFKHRQLCLPRSALVWPLWLTQVNNYHVYPWHYSYTLQKDNTFHKKYVVFNFFFSTYTVHSRNFSMGNPGDPPSPPASQQQQSGSLPLLLGENSQLHADECSNWHWLRWVWNLANRWRCNNSSSPATTKQQHNSQHWKHLASPNRLRVLLQKPGIGCSGGKRGGCRLFR